MCDVQSEQHRGSASESEAERGCDVLRVEGTHAQERADGIGVTNLISLQLFEFMLLVGGAPRFR